MRLPDGAPLGTGGRVPRAHPAHRAHHFRRERIVALLLKIRWGTAPAVRRSKGIAPAAKGEEDPSTGEAGGEGAQDQPAGEDFDECVSRRGPSPPRGGAEAGPAGIPIHVRLRALRRAQGAGRRATGSKQKEEGSLSTRTQPSPHTTPTTQPQKQQHTRRVDGTSSDADGGPAGIPAATDRRAEGAGGRGWKTPHDMKGV
jgi:hypothetical protein